MTPPLPSEAILVKLRPCRDEMFQRLFKGESLQQVSEDIAQRVGTTAATVQAFYNDAWQ